MMDDSSPRQTSILFRPLLLFPTEKNGLAAAQWAAQLGNLDSDSGILANVVRSWVSKDREGALDWIGKLPAGDTRDTVIRAATQSLVANDARLAMRWATSIHNEGNRAEAILETYTNWKRLNTEAARQWVASTQLTPELRKRIQETDPSY